jgi:4-hydroxybenzoate polyprenyltransferase
MDLLALMRMDRPVGTLLLLWPTLAALWMAAGGQPGMDLILIFGLGTLLMRSAGCVVNDIADRNFDGYVARTADRPLASGRLSVGTAVLLLLALLLAAALLLLGLNPLTRWLALVGLALALSYPFFKRFTYLPQVPLGAAFSWAMVMAFAAVQNTVPDTAWLLFTASLLWIVAYDTYYAMVDRDDDLKVGIKSTAILFGAFVLAGRALDYGSFYFAGLLIMGALFAYQFQITRRRQRAACLAAFKNNIWVGFALFAGTLLELNLPALW